MIPAVKLCMKLIRTAVILLFVFSEFFISGCRLNDLKEIIVVLPDLPPEWESFGKDICAELVYYSEGEIGTVCGLEFGDKKAVETEKNVVPFSVYPVLKPCGERLKPAGGIFPVNYAGNELEISWKNGFASEVILKLSEKGADFRNFNIRRFEDVLFEKSGGNPWRISDTAVLYSLSAGIFNSNHISVKQPLNMELVHDFLDSEWIFADPAESRILHPVSGIIQLDNIYSGHHFLIRKEGGEVKYAEIFADNEKWTAFFSGGEGGLSGRF